MYESVTVCDNMRPGVTTATLCGARVAIKYYAKLILTHTEANLPQCHLHSLKKPSINLLAIL